MNWLAHLLLSEQTPESWMGNLLPDFLRGPELQMLPVEFGHGIRLHRIIDAFTDSHPIFLQSRRRMAPQYRRYSGIIVDVFYDHLLAREWPKYAAVEFEQFLREVYAGLQSRYSCIPEHARERLEWMIDTNLLGSYRETEGIRQALQRIGRRLRRPVDLGDAVTALEEESAAFTQDFHAFFPQLQAHVHASGRAS